jgi:hypothetical protein
VTVGEILNRIDEFDREMTIYAKQPFSLSSEAVVDFEPEATADLKLKAVLHYKQHDAYM